jgi:hypothetical protein
VQWNVQELVESTGAYSAVECAGTCRKYWIIQFQWNVQELVESTGLYSAVECAGTCRKYWNIQCSGMCRNL